MDPETPELQAAPALTAYHLHCWPRAECKTKTSHAGVPDWQFETWPVHDIIRVNGL